MSEAITKACPVCEGTQRFKSFECPCCDGGRVPDVEATLRAQLDAARIMCERFDSQLRTKESENAELRGEVARLNDLLVDAHDRLAVMTGDLQESRVEKSSLAAEVERLSAECKTRHAHEVALENEKLRMYDVVDC